MKISEAELNAEAIKAGTFYVKTSYQGAPLESKQIALNSSSHGFYMGVRWLEKQIEEQKLLKEKGELHG